MVSVRKDTLRVPLSLFWSRSSSSNIYQDIKISAAGLFEYVRPFCYHQALKG